jgi:hypothetical protein
MMILSEVHTWSGVIDLDVLINDKVYTYSICSFYAVNKIKSLLNGKHPKPGKALIVLDKFKVEIGGIN